MRDVEDVIAEGAARQLAFVEIVEMPVNNLSVLLRRLYSCKAHSEEEHR